jgi:hypothetical protein
VHAHPACAGTVGDDTNRAHFHRWDAFDTTHSLDPDELQNRAGDPAYAAAQATLAARLRQLRTDWVP